MPTAKSGSARALSEAFESTQSLQSSDPGAPTIAPSAGSASEPTVIGETDEFIGLTLDSRYLVEKKIGHGGMGQVFLAKDLQLHSRLVVVKLLLEEAYKDPYILKKFQQEMEALSRIQHPGVIGIIDSGEFSGAKPYIVMEYVEGVNLRSVIKPEGMNLERAADIIKQIGRALSAAHEKGIVHRDLKPENIMLKDQGHGEELVKIIDFGIAKIKQSAIAPTTATTATAGTMAYMAPEQLSAKPISLTADIYSLGIIAYEMVTGRRPFNPESPFELLEMQRAGVRVQVIDLRPSLSRQAQHSILKALSFDPNQRHRSAREFADELTRALLNDEETAELRDPESRWLKPTMVSEDPVGLMAPMRNAADTPPNQPNPSEQVALDDQTRSSPPSAAPTAPRGSRSWNKPWLMLSIGLLSLLIVGAALYALVFTHSVQHTLTYWLTVQRMREGKVYEQPFKSSGMESFENGYAFQLNVSSRQGGYLYVLNEGASDNGAMSVTMIYPTPETAGGSAKLEVNHAMQSDWIRFAGQPGTEEFCLVWSTTPVPELEAARDAAFKSGKGKGALTDAALVRTVREFLNKNLEPKPEATTDTQLEQTTVRGAGDLLVQRLELKHR